MGCTSSRNKKSALVAAGITEAEVNDKIKGVDGGQCISGGDIVAQKIALHHAVNDIFLYAPVKVRTLTEKGEDHIWVTLDDRAVDQQIQGAEAEKNKSTYPLGVSIDKNGNIRVVSAEGADKSYDIVSKDVMAAFKVPVMAQPPNVTKVLPESIALSWPQAMGLVSRYEVQYRVADKLKDNVKWECGACSLQNESTATKCEACETPKLPTPPSSPKRAGPGTGTDIGSGPINRMSKQWETVSQTAGNSRNIVVTRIACAVPYMFRIRAQNRNGWGEYSPACEPVSARPDIPDVCGKPVCAKSLEGGLLLYWPVPAANGSHITGYEVKGGSKKEKDYKTVYNGSNPYVLIDKLIPKYEYHYQVCCRNGVGQSEFGEYGDFRTAVEGMDEAEAPEGDGHKTPWVELRIPGFNKGSVYVNTRTGKDTFERPVEMDGPVDPMIEFKKKRFHFLRVLLQDAPKGVTEVTRLNIRRDNIFKSSVDQVLSFNEEEMRKRFKIDYEGEEGIDAGGLSKDWFLEVSRILMKPNSGLFKKAGSAPGAGMTIDSNTDFTPKEVERVFEFAGRFLGKAIYDRQLVDVQFDDLLSKQVLGQNLDLSDIRNVEPELVKSLEWMLENDIEDILFETFSIEIQPKSDSTPGSPKGPKPRAEIIDLIPGGRNIEVDNENKRSYVEHMLEYRVRGSVKTQLDAFKRGFNLLIPQDLVNHFDVHELDMLWNGKREINVVEIRSQAIYQGGFDANTLLVHWFWSLFKELDDEKKQMLVRFVTGTPKIPLDGYDPKFNLTSNADMSPNSLPKAHTCFNQLVLPPYETKNQLKDKVLYAIQNSEGFLLG